MHRLPTMVPPVRQRWLRLPLALLLAGTLNGCPSDPSDKSDKSDQSDASDKSELSDADLERLQMLGYEPWVEDSTDEPQPTSVLVRDAVKMAPGYTLFASRGACEAVLIDAEGRRVHQWSGEPCGFWEDIELLDDGSLLVVGATSGNFQGHMETRFLQRYAWDSKSLWRSDFPAHHEVSRLEDGRLLVLAHVEREDSNGDTIQDDRVRIVTLDGKVVEDHSVFELIQATPGMSIVTRKRDGARRKGRMVYDPFHTNAADWVKQGPRTGQHPLYKPGNIVVSMRNRNFVGVFDRDSKQFVWSWGEGVLEGPHSARMLDNGHVLVFDNGRRRRWSRVIEIDPLRNEIVWEYQAAEPSSFFTEGGGSARRLANGNTLVSETRKGRLFELTPQKEIVWEFLNPARDPHDSKSPRATIYSAERIPPAFVDAILANQKK